MNITRKSDRLFDESAPRARALMAHLEITDPEELSEERWSSVYDEGVTFSIGWEEWGVLTEEEAEDAWEAALEAYLDGVVLPEVPEHLRNYFDHEAWKRDARMDGRGHALSPYDCTEWDATDPVTGSYFLLYRTN